MGSKVVGGGVGVGGVIGALVGAWVGELVGTNISPIPATGPITSSNPLSCNSSVASCASSLTAQGGITWSPGGGLIVVWKM